MIYIMWTDMFTNVVIILQLTQIHHRRFSDQDVLMQYHWGLDVGHLHVHGLTSTTSWKPNQLRDTDAPDNLSTHPEDLTGDIELNATSFDNNTCDEMVNPEMALDEHDLEDWKDIKSNTSETGCGNGNDESEDDFEEMYE